MEIHLPHSIRSFKDFGLQLVTITAGILIALSLEGIRESFHERALVREARANIRREIADNQREVDREISEMAERTRKIDAALRLVNDLLTKRHTDVRTVELGLSFPTLSTASWQTAERTGAFGHMEYAEVQKYASVYTVQELMVTQHRRAIEALSSVLGILAAGEDGDPTKAAPADLERLRQQLIALRSILFVEEQVTRAASEHYRKALE